MKKRLNLILILLLFILAACNGSSKSDGPSSKPLDNGNPFDPNDPTQCLAVDTDGDGLIDCKDPDMDGDSFINEIDAFPYDPTEWLDTDGDGYGDNSDRFPLDPMEWADFDLDVVGNNADADDDNDGVPDLFEYFLFEKNTNDWIDIDGDQIGLSIDEDDDNDGVADMFDDLRWNSSGGFDIDNDLVPNNQDSDMDGDLAANLVDAFPYDSLEWMDTDLDRLGNNIDPDDDNDGFPDSWEDFPLDKDHQFDSDGDSFANALDAFPYNPNEWVDSDNDSVGDNSDPFPFNPEEWADTDQDGIGDNSDQDVDNDGFRNCIPVNTGIAQACNQDSFPYDNTEWVDTDADAVGDNADADDDNDGIADLFDSFSKESLHFSDFDSDAMPDSTFPATQAQAILLEPGKVFFVYDEDADNDGCPNVFEDLSYDRFDCFDIDNDKIGNNRDTDKDGDEVLDLIDRFPYDSTESADTDEDGLGNNLDEDDDNDGVWDIADSLPFNKFGFSDYNNDGIPDQDNLDIDGDGKPNGFYTCEQTNIYKRGYDKATLNPSVSKTQCQDAQGNIFPAHSCRVVTADALNRVCSFPPLNPENLNARADLYPFDNQEWQDLDYDDLADNLIDADDDNDGSWDISDDFPTEKREDKSYSFTDLDGDGVPSHSYRYNDLDSLWEFVFDPDIDNDGIDDGVFSCTPRTDNNTIIDCIFTKKVQVQAENPRSEIPGEPEFIYVFRLFDHFPYNNQEAYDYDNDGIGDNSDIDADGDGYENCLPINLDPSQSCNEDKLPLVGLEDPFVSAKYYPFDDSNINAITYCGSGDCFFKNYDRDNDGLSDYEEYLFDSNPLLADGDGDGVPDLNEREDGTDPDDETSYKDDDADGIPNFSDKTPKGAFDEGSLREQISNASACLNKQYEEVCVDSATDLCSWQLIEPAQYITDPNDPTGPQIRAGKCISKDILVTKDFDVTDCFNIVGEVNIKGQNRYTLNFPAAISSGSRCSGTEVTPIRMEADSSLKLENVHLQSNVVDQLIDSEGLLLKLVNTSVFLENENLPGVIKFNQSGSGTLDIYKSTIVSKVTTTDAPVSFKPNMEINVKTINLNSVIIDCDVSTWTDYVNSGFFCVSTDSDSMQADYMGSSISNDGEPASSTANIISWNHNSRISAVLANGIQSRTSYQGINLTGTGLSYNVNQTFINDRNKFVHPTDDIEYGFMKVNGAQVQVKTQESKFGYGLFKYPIPQLSCSTLTLDFITPPIATVNGLHPYYFVGTPVNAKLTPQVIQTFNDASLNLTPEGEFATQGNFDTWNDFKGKTTLDSGVALLDQSVYSDASARLVAESASGTGIGRYLNIQTNKKYKVSFNVRAAEVDRNVELDFKLFEGTSGEIIRLGKIKLKTASTPENYYNEGIKLLNYYVDYENSLIEFSFRATADINPADIGFMIYNNSINDSKDVYVDNIKFLQSDEYSIQYPGITQPICTE